ncbi:MAG TPA: ABC transporter substrate-binding protein [Pseudolysinimonas sp.]
MRTRTLSIVAGVAVLAAALAGCATSPGGSPSSSGGKVSADTTISIVCKGFANEFWQAVKSGALKAGKDFNVKVNFVGPTDETSASEQISLLQTTLAAHPDALGFAAIDSQAAAPLMQQAKSAGIPVIAFDSGVASDVPLTTVATDNKAAAGEAAKHIGELLGGTGTVAVVSWDQTSQSAVDRRDGFIAEIKKDYPNIKLLDTVYGATADKATDVAKAELTANPDIKAIFGANEASAIGVVHAVQELKITTPLIVVGFDSGQDQIDAINNGLEAGAITQDPVGMGYATVEQAVNAIEGKKLPKVIATGYYWYDKTNITDPKIVANLYH